MTRRTLTLGVTVMLLLVACKPGEETTGRNTAPDTTPAVRARQDTTAVKVRTVRSRDGVIETQRSAGGVIEALTDSNVAAETSGRVVRVLHRAGENVRAGETIIELDATGARDALRDARLQLQSAEINLRNAQQQQPATLASARSRVTAARTNLENAQRTLRANEELFTAGGLARNDLEQSRAAVASARADLQSAEGELSRAERAPSGDLALQRVQVEQARGRVEQLQRDVARASIKAPFAGQLAQVTPSVGEFVSQGSPVFRLLDTRSVRVTFRVPPADAQRLTVGRGVSVTLGGQHFDGRVTRNAATPGEGRLVDVSARLLGAPDVPVGASVVVQYRVNLASGTIIPTGALQVEGGQSYVFLAQGGQARQQGVTVLAESNGQVAVQGLDAGTPVVYPVPGGLQPDARIQVLAAQKGSEP